VNRRPPGPAACSPGPVRKRSCVSLFVLPWLGTNLWFPPIRRTSSGGNAAIEGRLLNLLLTTGSGAKLRGSPTVAQKGPFDVLSGARLHVSRHGHRSRHREHSGLRQGPWHRAGGAIGGRHRRRARQETGGGRR